MDFNLINPKPWLFPQTFPSKMPILVSLVPVANSEKMYHMYEDQMNKAKVKVKELQRQTTPREPERAHITSFNQNSEIDYTDKYRRTHLDTNCFCTAYSKVM